MTPVERARVRRLAHGIVRSAERDYADDPYSAVDFLLEEALTMSDIPEEHEAELERQLALLGYF